MYNSTQFGDFNTRRESDRSVFGRLLSSASDEEHRRAFLEWLPLNLERQLADLQDYLSSLSYERRMQVEARLETGSYSGLIPADAPAEERLLFQMDLEIVMELRQTC